MKGREVTPEELALWRHAMRNTMPLPDRDPNAAPAKAAPAASPGEKAGPSGTSEPAPRNRAAEPPARRGAPPGPGGLDAATARRLRRGRISVDARIDLHGMRQAEAYGVLTRFLGASQEAGRRCVLVITGKGGRAGGGEDAPFMHRGEDGVLRRQVPLWLRQEPNASRVFAIEPAHPRHGGAGAFYVFLRRKRRDEAS